MYKKEYNSGHMNVLEDGIYYQRPDQYKNIVNYFDEASPYPFDQDYSMDTPQLLKQKKPSDYWLP